jgi:hypothetical protein
MVSINDEIGSLFMGSGRISLLSYCRNRSSSVLTSLWESHVGACRNLFSGGTDEADEDKALRIIMRSESFRELAFMVEKLSWDVLDDELDEADLTQIAAQLSALRNRVEHAVDAVLRGLALNPSTFAQSQSADVDAAIAQRVVWLGGFGQRALADRLLARRPALLDSIAQFALRGLPTRVREFRVLVDDLASRVPALASDLASLSWSAFYDNRVCGQLEQARYRLLMSTLPDMVDPNLPRQRRRALFDTLDSRRDPELRAMQDFIGAVGTVEQRSDVQRFMDARRLFLDNFTDAPPTPDVIQRIAAFFDSVASEVVGLRTDVANATQGLIDSLTLGHLAESEKDDTSREAVGVLSGTGRLAVLATKWKSSMIAMMEEGNCDDDDEQAINEILKASKARSLADFAQLVAAQGWESLSTSFDEQEYDDLELLLSSW